MYRQTMGKWISWEIKAFTGSWITVENHGTSDINGDLPGGPALTMLM